MSKLQSQEPHGPFLISYGEFTRLISEVEFVYDLTKIQNRILTKFWLSLDRHGYYIHLLQHKHQKSQTWADLNHISLKHFSKEMIAMTDMGIFRPMKEGKRKLYRFSPEFIGKLLGGKLGSEIEDKLNDSLLTSGLIVHQPVDSLSTNQWTHSPPTSGLCSNIEEVSPMISLLPSHTSSFSPDPQAEEIVDKVTSQINDTFDLIHFDDPRQRKHVVTSVRNFKPEKRELYQTFLDRRKGSEVLLQGFLGWMQAWDEFLADPEPEIRVGEPMDQVFQ